MKKTWKLRGMGALAADTVRRAPSLRAAAKELGVNVSTLSRAIKAGTLPAPGARPAANSSVDTSSTKLSSGVTRENPTFTDAKAAGETFAAWARRTYTLTRAEDELITLAQAALDLANDASQSPTIRLQASARYAAVLRDLKLPTEDANGNTETTRRYPRTA
jgi:hypothetical protein